MDLQPSIREAFQHTPVFTNNYVRIRSVCKECGSQFIGDTGDLHVWEKRHMQSCKESAARKQAEARR